MLNDLSAKHIKVCIGSIDGMNVYEIYTVGQESRSNNIFRGKIVKEIRVTQLQYTKYAEIYYEDGSFQTAENVTQSFYDSRQGNTQ